MKGFWQNIIDTKYKNGIPFFVVAPMADVTDPVYRKQIAKFSRMRKAGGGPDVMWTEFVASDGLVSSGYDHLIKDLAYTEDERPIVAQIFGNNPQNIKASAAIVQSLGFNGLDINMGCPARTILEQGAGSELINHPELAAQIIRAAKEGAPLLPVSVKTRIGYNNLDWKPWLKTILDESPAVITLHLRTRKELSLVPAHWELMPEIVTWITQNYGTPLEGGPLIIGNGDIVSLEDAKQKCHTSGAHAAMIGRGIFGKPFFFDELSLLKPKTLSELFRIVIEHSKMYEDELPHKSFSIMKKHYKAYINSWPNASDLRVSLMEASTSKDVKIILDNYIAKVGDLKIENKPSA